MIQDLITCCIILVFLFISFIISAVHASAAAAIGAVCVSRVLSLLALCISNHRRRSLVNFGVETFCRKNTYEKLTKCPNFILFLPEKLSKYPNFYDICPKNLQNSGILHDYCPKKARILHNNCQRKIFFQKGALALPAPHLLCLC